MNELTIPPENNGFIVKGDNPPLDYDVTQPHKVEPSGYSNPSVFIIIPAYNEGPVIQEVILQVISNPEVYKLGCELVVVDDGSCDDTWNNVAMLLSSTQPNRVAPQTEYRFPVHLLRHVVNLGQGAALATGIQYALAKGAKIIVTFDADGQHIVEDIPRLVAPIMSGQVDVTLGSRFLPEPSQEKGNTGEYRHKDRHNAFRIPWPRRVLLKIAILFTGLTEKIWLSDVHNGLRAFSASAASQINITQNRMAHASEIIHEIAHLKLHYVEVPVHVQYTDYSRRKGQRASDALNIIIEILEVLFIGEENKP
jgi:polyprenyl-phospho-N-acetylgalactosaminyl synthase